MVCRLYSFQFLRHFDNSAGSESTAENDKSIVILFESDSHCELSGYPKLAGLRDAINQSDTAWAGIVCCGDFIQGGAVGSVSKGRYIVDVMQSVDLEKNYTVSLGVFYSSLGFYGMMKDCRIIRSVSDTTRDALEMYLMTVLKGQLGDSYKQPQGRITIVDD